MIATDARKKADVIKLYFIDLKKEMIEFIKAKARIQLFCLTGRLSGLKLAFVQVIRGNDVRQRCVAPRLKRV